MARYPRAIWRPWSPYSPERYITPWLVILHTNAVNAEDPGPTGGLSWHFQIGEHGDVYQHRDTNTRAAANADANGFAISIESWDGGDPEGNPWNPAQLNAIDALLRWCCDSHSIPTVQAASWDGTGIGYHRLFGQWNQPAHSCPGNTRIAQFPGILARLNGQEHDLTDEEHVQLWNTRADVDSLHVKVDQTIAKVDALAAAVQAIKVGGVDVNAVAQAVATVLAQRLAS